MKQSFKQTLTACYTGYVTQAIVNNIAPLLFIVFKDQYSLTYEMLGRLILINFGTQIIVDLLAMKYVDKIGYRKAAVIAHAFCTVGLAALGVLPIILPSPYVGLMIAAMVYAIGGGIIEVLISPIVDSLPGDAKASAMSLLHSFYCWGQVAVVLVTTLLLQAFGMKLWFVLPVLWALIPFYNLFRFMKVPLMPAVPDHEKTPFTQLLKSKVFIIALVLMLCAGASELTMSQWSSLFAQKGLAVPKLVGDLLGPCLFAVLMGAGRAVYGHFGHRVDLKKALAASAALCILCYAVTVFVQVPAISLAGCALCGLSVALMWPGTLSLSAARFPRGGTALFGALAVFGDIGASSGPWLTGWVSELTQKSNNILAIGAASGLNPDQLGLKMGLLVGMIFPVLLLIGILFMKGKKTADNHPAA